VKGKTITPTITPAAGDWTAPPERRLARLLKVMLRAFGWRVVDVRPADSGAKMNAEDLADK
jgi:hypothetical protein